ncbi:MAG: metal-dependent hydrolase [Methylobacter sp.]|uniref:metal-dependent hydrolase n=1 Tax=Methylobacter sp. TaxID=2051955 RepID=UPI00258A0515|nr:metal-dependent hydrolase [Methylobacter sp.]MCL7419845.1 metal-dependent hydrolase [Methylobacter sp.]
MANFKAHVSIAATASSVAALVAVDARLIDGADAPWLIFLGTIGGMLPDIDANNSKPVKLLFNALALLSVSAVWVIFRNSYAQQPLLLGAAATYVGIRYGLFNLFNSFTEHRGVFHSLLAAVFFACLMTCISFYFLQWDILHAWLNGLFVAIGFVVHLLLDELYSVDLSNTRMKKSFGTALKLFSYRNIPASALMTVCTIVLYWLAPPPTPLLKLWQAAHWDQYLSQAKLCQ